MRYFPVFLDLRGRPCLVVGETKEAGQKAESLRDAGAAVECRARLSTIVEKAYVLAVVATGDERTDTAAAQLLLALQIPVNVVDRPTLCSFIWPAIVDRDPVTIAISTAGTSPTLAKMIRERIGQAVPHAVGRLAALAGEMRGRVHRSLPTAEARRAFWQRVLAGPAGILAFTGQTAAALAALRRETPDAN